MKFFTPLVGLLCLATGVLAKTYNIDNYGAEADGKKLSTLAIQKAIDACTPGDTVLISAGNYVTGTLHLKSNITLYLEKDAVLLGSTSLNDYESYSLPGKPVTYYGMFFTKLATNITIAGFGTIEGNGGAFSNTSITHKADSAAMRYSRQKSNYRLLANTPVGFTTTTARPGQLIVFTNCQNVRINNLKLLNSPYWAMHFDNCTGVSLTGLRVWNNMQMANTDGLMLTGCDHVKVTGCDIRAGGNAITISGKFYYFERLPAVTISSKPTVGEIKYPLIVLQNFTITNCNLQASACGLFIGDNETTDINNVQVHHVNITNSNRGIGLLLRQEGSLENMTFNDMYIQTKLPEGNWMGNGEPIHLSAVPGTAQTKLGHIKNISFSNLNCTGENHILLYGSANSILQDVRFDDVLFNLQSSPLNEVAGGNIDLRGCADPQQALFASTIPAVMARYVSGLTINNIKVTWSGALTQPYFTDGIEVSNFKSFKLTGYTVKAAPGNINAHSVSLIDGTMALVDAGDIKSTRVFDPKSIKPGLKSNKKKAGIIALIK